LLLTRPPAQPASRFPRSPAPQFLRGWSLASLWRPRLTSRAVEAVRGIRSGRREHKAIAASASPAHAPSCQCSSTHGAQIAGGKGTKPPHRRPGKIPLPKTLAPIPVSIASSTHRGRLFSSGRPQPHSPSDRSHVVMVRPSVVAQRPTGGGVQGASIPSFRDHSIHPPHESSARPKSDKANGQQRRTPVSRGERPGARPQWAKNDFRAKRSARRRVGCPQVSFSRLSRCRDV
jgi:hypothetical protein